MNKPQLLLELNTLGILLDVGEDDALEAALECVAALKEKIKAEVEPKVLAECTVGELPWIAEKLGWLPSERQSLRVRIVEVE